MTNALRWWLSAPMSGGKAAALVLGAWLALAFLVAAIGAAAH